MKAYTDGTNTIAAEDAFGIQAVLVKYYGNTDFPNEEFNSNDWKEIHPDKLLTIAVDGTDASKETKTVAEWLLEQKEPSLICSTEW